MENSGGNMFRKKLILMLLALFICSVVFAELKIAYIDTDRIVMESSETQEAQTSLLNDRQKWEKEITDLEQEIEELVNEYESRKLIMGEESKKEAEDKITQLQDKRQNKVKEYFGENGKYYQRQNELLEPILSKLKNVIEKVSIENNYTIVLDAAAGSILYAKPSLDITDKIIDELEKTIEE